MSPSVAQGLTAARPSRTLWRVTSTRRWRSGLTSPMQNMRLESEKYPSRMVEQSTLTMSPSLRTSFSLGMPWQTTLLMEVQTLLGKPS